MTEQTMIRRQIFYATIPNLGCKFCHYVFSLSEIREYKDHLWRFHRDDLQEDLNKIVHEINRIEKMPQ